MDSLCSHNYSNQSRRVNPNSKGDNEFINYLRKKIK